MNITILNLVRQLPIISIQRMKKPTVVLLTNTNSDKEYVAREVHLNSYKQDVFNSSAPHCLQHAVRSALKKYFEQLNGESIKGLYDLVIAEIEKPLLETTLAYTNGNQSQAALILGMNRGTLRKKLQRYN